MENNTQPTLSNKQNGWMAIKFVLFSASAGIIQLLSFTLLNEFAHVDRYTRLDELLGNDYGLSYFLALILSVLWNFTLNRKFTFKSVANIPVAMLKVFGYYLVFTPLSIWWGVALTNHRWNDYVVLGMTMLANLCTEFFFDRYVVFRNNLYTNDAAQLELSKKASCGESGGIIS